MKRIEYFLLCLLFILISTSSYAQESWTLVYEHDGEGKAVSGSKETLIEAVRAGKEVRVGWKMGSTRSVEHFAEVQFLTIMNGEVFGQITAILSQAPKFDDKQIEFREDLKWSFIASTTGTNSTLFYDFTDGSILDKSKYKWSNKWFIRQ